MGKEMDLIVLTKSSKRGGFCVAGLNVTDASWVRLVTENVETDGAIPHSYMQAVDGNTVEVLDMINVSYKEKNPKEFQKENVIVDLAVRPVIVKRNISLSAICRKHPLEIHPQIFGSTFSYATEEYLNGTGVNYSLMLIKVEKLVLKKENGKSKVDFTYQKVSYKGISMTDPDYYNQRYYVGDNPYNIGKAIIVVSLGNRWGNTDKYYKFVAKIFPIE